MINTILEGRKTQTRRVAKLLLPGDKNYIHAATHKGWVSKRATQSRFGMPGDRLWVREGWQWFGRTRNGAGPEGGFQYRADLAQRTFQEFQDPDARWRDFLQANEEDKLNRWRPSIHMPRWASRITLETTDIRVERLRDISEEDAKAEGMESLGLRGGWDGQMREFYSSKESLSFDPVRKFRLGWDGLNAKRGYGWEKNPWVWVITFKRIECKNNS